MRIRGRNLQTQRSVKKEGKRYSKHLKVVKVPLQPMRKIIVRQDVLWQAVKIQAGADVHLQPGSDG